MQGTIWLFFLHNLTLHVSRNPVTHCADGVFDSVLSLTKELSHTPWSNFKIYIIKIV